MKNQQIHKNIILPDAWHMPFKTLCYTVFLTSHLELQHKQLQAIQLSGLLCVSAKSHLRTQSKCNQPALLFTIFCVH